ncbi:MAG TPA: FAD/NAD(P)-binding protein [Actinocatenispora sp.]
MRIAVIGGGPAAVALLDGLLLRADRFRSNPEIHIYEPSGPAYGQAFRPDLDSALINLPNGRMSIRAHEPAHFLNWLESSAGTDPALAERHAPRSRFGAYLTAQLDRGRAVARELGWHVEVVPETVLAVAGTADRALLVRTAAGARTHSHVVLGIGSGSNADPYRLARTPNFVADPYPLAATLPGVAPDAHVLIVGTGLTAVDAALGLLHLGHRGRITMASRTGILPRVRRPVVDWEPRHLTVERVAALGRRAGGLRLPDVWDLLRRELTAAGFDAEAETARFRPVRSHADDLREQLAERVASPVHSIYAALLPTPLPPLIRATLPPEDMRQVAYRFKHQLKSVQCPMPPETGRTLLAAMDRGQLTVLGGLTYVGVRGRRFAATAELATVPDADVVVDATRLSPARTTGRARHLVRSLTGHVRWDPFHALRVDPATCRVLPGPGQPHRMLYAIGEITIGDLYHASSLPAVSRGAALVAEDLARQADRPHHLAPSTSGPGRQR